CVGGGNQRGARLAPVEHVAFGEAAHHQAGRRADIDTLLQDPLLRGATSGLVVRSLTEGDVLYRREPGTPLIPASNA
ncbi:D-alanyl-D-alanine carboxypeptidase, partial [Marinitenerispora sediminis]|uniref:D-alanyl-D-alanine carboxypeptidase n=1 Tax=Marinitenerispora sediminis TaxID=1931232 RepID=UPI000E02CA8B